MNPKDIITGIRFIGISTALRTFRYSVYRDNIEKRYQKITAANELQISPGSLISHQSVSKGIAFRFERASMTIEVLASDLIRVTWEPGKVCYPYAIAKADWNGYPFKHKSTDEKHTIETGDIQVDIFTDGSIHYKTPTGKLLREEVPPERKGNAWIHRVLLEPTAHLYGLGERAAPLNLRGGSYLNWNRDPNGSYSSGNDPIYLCIPAYSEINTTGGYFIFYENPYPSLFKLTETAEVLLEDGALRYYFIPGFPEQTLKRYTELTGRAALPPRWALGYHQSRWGYKTEQDIRSIVSRFENHQLPISAIHLDIDYMDGFRVFTINKQGFPDLKKLSQELEAKNIKLVAILDPGVKKDKKYPLYQQGLEKDYFILDPRGKPVEGIVWPGEALFPDFTKPEVREWWAEQYKTLIDEDVAGFWHDMNEPVTFVAWGDNRLPLSSRHNIEGLEGDHHQAHNIYGLLMARAGIQGITKHRPEKRPWIVSRSGWAGIQKYAWNWTGDTETSWKVLHQTIATVLGLGLSGQPFSGPDIGGFSGAPSPELYVRWLQLASFLPFFRTHSAKGTPPREPWTFGESALTIARKYIELRYKLMPYIYTLAWEASQTGAPLARPLFWDEPMTTELQSIDNAFLLGNSLLIAPIIREGMTSRNVILPSGCWYDFWDEKFHTGGKMIQAKAPLDTMPIYVRGGSILPLQEDSSHLALHFYPPHLLGGYHQHPLQLYSDAGDGPIRDTKDWRLDTFDISLSGGVITISRRNQGEFPFPYEHVHLHVHGVPASQTWIDGKQVRIIDNAVSVGLFDKLRLVFKS